MLILSQRVLDTLLGTDFGWQSRNQLAKWISKSERGIGRGFVWVRGVEWWKVKMFWNLHKLSAGNWKAKRTNWNNEATVLVCHSRASALDSLGEREASIKCRRLCFNLWQFSPRTCKSNPLPSFLPRCCFCCTLLLQLQSQLHFEQRTPANGSWNRSTVTPLEQGVAGPCYCVGILTKKFKIKEANGLQKKRNQTKAKSLKIKQKSLLALGWHFFHFFYLSFSLSLVFSFFFLCFISHLFAAAAEVCSKLHFICGLLILLHNFVYNSA